MLIAEDSTAFPNVTRPVKEGGLGFDYKWDMGWMHDTSEYFRMPPKERTTHYHKLTFSMYYFYFERFLMPLSHDKVVHGKGTIINKIYGEYEEKFAQARALYMYMYAHPGKQLNFMGNEIGHFREWDE
jgi:1,4-alpha-glucan branching enzyme